MCAFIKGEDRAFSRRDKRKLYVETVKVGLYRNSFFQSRDPVLFWKGLFRSRCRSFFFGDEKFPAFRSVTGGGWEGIGARGPERGKKIGISELSM